MSLAAIEIYAGILIVAPLWILPSAVASSLIFGPGARLDQRNLALSVLSNGAIGAAVFWLPFLSAILSDLFHGGGFDLSADPELALYLGTCFSIGGTAGYVGHLRLGLSERRWWISMVVGALVALSIWIIYLLI